MNKKGFTLTELLVVVVILGIISGLSIPLIRNLTSTFEIKKYQIYADNVLASAKLFNDSYTEDLFGNNEYGCAYIPYEKLVEKKLIKDIQIADVTCNSNKTYVRVTKVNDKYGYATYLTCGTKTKQGNLKEVKRTIPNEIPDMNNNVCTGVDESNLLITAIDAQTGGKQDKNRKKAKIKIESGTGINTNMLIYAKWSQDSNDHTNTGFEKIDFKVTGDQEKTILNGGIISTISNELVSPALTGKYYLILRVDRLTDLYGHPWKNKTNPESKYIYFGPFMLDSTEPEIVVDVYNCNSNYEKTGSKITSKTQTGKEVTFDLSSMTGTIDGWAAYKNFPYGICFEFGITDEASVKTASWEWNETNQKKNASGYKTFPANNISVENYNDKQHVVINKSLIGNGHRYARISAKDLAGNNTAINIDLKLDNVGPNSLTVTNPYENTWTNNDVVLTLASTDKNELNKIGDYYYTYNKDATSETDHSTNGNDSMTKWVKLNGGTGKASFTTEAWNKTMDRTVYISSSDAVGNYSSVIKSTKIKIDKTKPVLTVVNDYEDTWTKNNVNLTLSAIDNASGIQESGIDEYYYSYKENATSYDGTTDNDAKTKWVKLAGGTGKTSFTTQALWTTTMNTTVYVRVKDKVGNYSDVVSTKIKIDKTPPKKPIVTGSSNWSKSITMTVKSRDDQAGIGTESGIKEFQYKYSGIDWTTSTENSSSSGDGISVWDGQGGSSSGHVDERCEIFEFMGRECPYGANVSPIDDSVEFSSNNNAPDEELCEFYEFFGIDCPYSSSEEDDGEDGEDGEGYTVHRHNFTSPKGTTTVNWRVCDNAGNCSETSDKQMKIDRTSPTCKKSVSGTTVTFTCSDSQSGCSGTNPYSVEDPDGSGVNHTFSDRAGNSTSCGKAYGEAEDDDEGGGYYGGESSCSYSCSNKYLVQHTESSAPNCSAYCGGPPYYADYSNLTLYRHDVGNGGYYYVCGGTGSGTSTGMGCCYCWAKCDEVCEG